MNKTLIVYRSDDDKEPFTDWLYSLRDKVVSARIEARIARIKSEGLP